MKAVIPGVPYTPSRAAKILRDCKSSEEVELECAKWVVDILDDHKILPVPMKPESVKEYESLDPSERNYLNEDYFKDHPDIRPYYDKCRKATMHNSDTITWLKKCREILMKNNLPMEGRKITAKLESWEGDE